MGVLKTVLELGEARQFKSIAFPALGTGNLKYPADEVCRLLFEAATEWGTKEMKHLKTINFILHAKDNELVEVSYLNIFSFLTTC